MNTSSIRAILLLLQCVVSFDLFAQTSVLSGEVRDKETNEALIGVHVRTDLGQGTISDENGQFRLPVNRAATLLISSYIGYQNDTLSLQGLSQDQLILIQMSPEYLREVVIYGGTGNTPGLKDAGVITLSGATLEKLPTVLGDREVMRAIQLLPGVQSGNEGARGIFVRGGGPDQNLVLFEGAPVFNVAHLYGIFSVFNSDIIGKADLHKNHLPARYGGRLASVLEVDTRPASMSTREGGLQTGLFTSKAHFSTPLVKDKLSAHAAMRACYAGLFSRPISEKQFASSNSAGNIGYYFYDINASLYAKPSEKHRLEWHIFNSDDIYQLYERWNTRFPDENGFRFVSDKNSSLRWGNLATSARWRVDINERWNYGMDLYFSKYQLRGGDDVFRRLERPDTSVGGFNTLFNNISSVMESGVRGTFSYRKEKHGLQTGYSALIRSFDVGRGDVKEQRQGFDEVSRSFGSNAQRGYETDIFAEYSLRLNRFRMDAGARMALYAADDGFKQLSVQPRFLMELQLGSLVWQATGSYSVQNIHLLTSSAGSILNDIWVPANSFALPESTWQGGTGVRQNFPKGYVWSADLFYRTITNVLEYNEGASYISFGRDWQRQVALRGQGRAYGLELFAAKTAGDLTAWAKYTLSRSERQFDDLNRGNWFPFKYDRTHDASVAINYQLTERIDVSVSWVYGTGNAFTLPTTQYPSIIIRDFYQFQTDQDIQNLSGDWSQIRFFEARNNFRLRAFHHLDVGMNYKWKSQRAVHTFNVSVYNVYNRLNVFNVYLKFIENDDRSVSLSYHTLSLMPILPSLSYAVSF